MSEKIPAMRTKNEPAPSQLDIRRLNDERFSRPEEPLWATLARLGWLPPSTAENFRRRIHELEGTHKVAADLEIGDRIRPAAAGLEIIGIVEREEFIHLLLEDGSRARFSRLDVVPTSSI